MLAKFCVSNTGWYLWWKHTSKNKHNASSCKARIMEEKFRGTKVKKIHHNTKKCKETRTERLRQIHIFPLK